MEQEGLVKETSIICLSKVSYDSVGFNVCMHMPVCTHSQQRKEILAMHIFLAEHEESHNRVEHNIKVGVDLNCLNFECVPKHRFVSAKETDLFTQHVRV